MNFKDIAKERISLAKIMEGRDKISTEDLIINYPNGFIIDEIEYITIPKSENDIDEFWAFHVKDTNKFAFAGYVLSQIFEEFLKTMEGDYKALYTEFAQSGGIKVKLRSEFSKANKRPITLVDIIDD